MATVTFISKSLDQGSMLSTTQRRGNRLSPPISSYREATGEVPAFLIDRIALIRKLRTLVEPLPPANSAGSAYRMAHPEARVRYMASTQISDMKAQYPVRFRLGQLQKRSDLNTMESISSAIFSSFSQEEAMRWSMPDDDVVLREKSVATDQVRFGYALVSAMNNMESTVGRDLVSVQNELWVAYTRARDDIEVGDSPQLAFCRHGYVAFAAASSSNVLSVVEKGDIGESVSRGTPTRVAINRVVSQRWRSLSAGEMLSWCVRSVEDPMPRVCSLDYKIHNPETVIAGCAIVYMLFNLESYTSYGRACLLVEYAKAHEFITASLRLD